MKQLFLLFSFCFFLVPFTSCDDTASGDDAGVKKGDGTKDAQCLVSTDCNSGVCKDHKCQVGGGKDNCDGSGQCGDCDSSCKRNDIGSKEKPFVLKDKDSVSGGVIIGDDGSITIDVAKASTRIETNFIWIANTSEGTISKVDTKTYKEVARYITGPDGTSNDPSRTSVNAYGDVFVGNRSAQSVTKISSQGENCQDRNGDGKVTTSQGPTDVLAWGQDDCIVWNTKLPGSGLLRAVAAQDSNGDDTFRAGVWAGGWSGKIWKLDSDNGSIMLTTQSPIGVNYGFALDGYGNLWISGLTARAIGRISTFACKDEASCGGAVCDEAKGANCVKQKIPYPHMTYGITVDYKQRVWTGGENITVYDPKKAAGQRFSHASVDTFVHGIAADEKGWIWAAADAAGVFRVEADNVKNILGVPGTQQSSKGVAVDFDGKIWSINITDNSATVITPGAGLNDNKVEAEVIKTLVGPYTYSDMTGAQLRFATDQDGFYRKVFDGCSAVNVPQTYWSELRWDVETPGKTKISFKARSADTRVELGNAKWISVATIAPDVSPKDIGSIFEAEGIQGRKFVEIEAQLKSFRKNEEDLDAPKLKAMSLTFRCPIILQ